MSAEATAMRTWFRQVGALMAKELRQLWRDRVLFVFVVYIFTGNIVLAAGEVGTELHRAALVVHDADRTPASRELIARFQPPYFHLVAVLTDPRVGAAMLDRGEATILLDIPERFEERLHAGREGAAVQVLVDATHASLGYLAASYAERIGARFAAEHAERAAAGAVRASATAPAIDARVRVWHNPDLDERWFGTLAELLTMITVACVLLPGAALVREKERGTIEQLLVSPVTPVQVMLAKVLSMVLVTLGGTAVALYGIMQPVYGVPVHGSATLFFALTAIYAFASAGLGLVAATFTRKTGQVGLLVLLMVVPIVLLSGIRAPWESMPWWLRQVMTLSPLHHFMEIANGILLRGTGLDVLWGSALAMCGLGAVLFAAGVLRYAR